MPEEEDFQSLKNSNNQFGRKNLNNEKLIGNRIFRTYHPDHFERMKTGTYLDIFSEEIQNIDWDDMIKNKLDDSSNVDQDLGNNTLENTFQLRTSFDNDKKRTKPHYSMKMRFKKNNLMPEKCMICLDDFEDNQIVKKFQCLHTYHPSCINSWLTKSILCPTCKHSVN